MNRTEVVLTLMLGIVAIVQSIVGEWIRRRATGKARAEIAEQAAQKIVTDALVRDVLATIIAEKVAEHIHRKGNNQ